jgi:uncharacterized protein (DUF433 family)
MPIDRITTDPGNLDGEPCIRGLSIKFWFVYRDLAFHGMTESEILKKYPGLEPKDIPAVREYAIHLIKSRDHDEITGRPLLPKDRLRHGAFYKGRCRHATICRWNAEEQCFYPWREKMGLNYIDTIKYPTDEAEPWWDVFDVVEELPDCRFEIPFDGDVDFEGDSADLVEFNEEMWSRPK